MDAWKERFVDEYKELDERCHKLAVMLTKMRNGTLEFTPNCSYDLLHEQLVYMQAYREVLQRRAEIEGIKVND